MSLKSFSRRDFSLHLGVALAGLGVAGTMRASADSGNAGEISHDNAAIHQEIDFAASAARIYQALTSAEQFDQVVRLSAAMNSQMKTSLGTTPTQIDAQAGGAFSLFGGYISGRTIELVPDARIVQAWRTGSWEPGRYSIAQFVLVAQGSKTKLVFDHTGFPNDAASHLAEGWHGNYWEPLGKLLEKHA